MEVIKLKVESSIDCRKPLFWLPPTQTFLGLLGNEPALTCQDPPEQRKRRAY